MPHKGNGAVQSGSYQGQLYFVMEQSDFNKHWWLCNLIDRRPKNPDRMAIFAQREIHEKHLEAE